jgi:DNA-binding GntR family transcriptional regulator
MARLKAKEYDEPMKSAVQSIGQLARVTLGEQVHAELRQLLMAGKLVPGEKLSLRNMAESLGVSVMPVREAVTRLAAEDALTVAPNRAIIVPLMTKEKLRELTLIRCEIEGFAAAQAALNRTEADLKLIRSLDAQFRTVVTAASPNADKALRLNKELHFAIYGASRLPTLVAMIEGLWLKVGPVINLDLRSSSRRLGSGTAEKHHSRIVAAIGAKKPEQARTALAADIMTSSQYIQATGGLPD